MVAFGPSILCRDAEPYYYDYLCGLEAEIPQAVIDHIRRCPDCRVQIRQLEAALGESEVRERHGDDADVVGELSLHFAHLGQDITCATVKSFLPVLLIPSLQIRIPTPVTVHVDHCRQCSEDLETLRELELRPEQLARLSRLYAAIADGEPPMCRRARAKTWAFACASFEGIDAESLDHMCVCPRCRRRVYRRREKILAGRQPGDTIAGVGLCSGISMADLFEWVAPYGRAGDSPGQATAGEEMPSHLQACPECIEKMQALHRTIYGIAERVDSGVSTVYTTGSEVKAGVGVAESLYCGYPIHVAVAHPDPQPAVIRFQPIMRIREVLERGAASPQFRPVMKAALTAAAMISLAVLLIVSIRPASAVTVRQLSDNVRNVGNVRITLHQYGEDGREGVMELLIKRDSGLVVIRGRQKDACYDFKGHEKMVRRLSGGTIERAPLEPEEQVGLEEYIDDVLGLAMTGVPENAGLQPVASDTPEGVAPDSLVYELEWDADRSDGSVLHYRLRASLDPVTKLPKRTELSRVGPEDQPRMVSVREFQYPSRQTMDLAIDSAFSTGQNHSGDHRGL